MKNNKNKIKILIFGASGLVGSSVLRELLQRGYKKIALAYFEDKKLSVNRLRIIEKEYSVCLKKYEKNVFVQKNLSNDSFQNIFSSINKTKSLERYIKNKKLSKESSVLFDIINDFKPTFIIDCINTATICSYINNNGKNDKTSLGLFLLLKYFQNLNNVFKRNFASKDFHEIQKYIKIGTTGIGGMGLNMPFTHGEDKPSMSLLKKVAFAGAQTNILLAMRRNNYIKIKEIIPSTAIFSKELLISQNDRIMKYQKSLKINNKNTHFGFDGGESGLYSVEEFSLLSNKAQMGFIEVMFLAKIIADELFKDKQDALLGLDKYCIKNHRNSYKLRKKMINDAKQIMALHNIQCVAHGNLGPYIIRRILFEATIFTKYLTKNRFIFFKSNNKVMAIEINKDLMKDRTLVDEINFSGLKFIKYNYKKNQKSIKKDSLLIYIDEKKCRHWKTHFSLLGLQKKNAIIPTISELVSNLIIFYNNDLQKFS
ncbi:MAG: hypothetical protein V1898_04945 [Patescibacteria group bacterium]